MVKKILCIALYAALILGFWVGIDVHEHTAYVAWAFDLHHTSMSFAFLCAACCGVMWTRL